MAGQASGTQASVQESGKPRLFWTLGEFAREVGIAEETARRWCLAKKVAGARKIAGTWLIHRPTFEGTFQRSRTGRPRSVGPDTARFTE